MMYFSYSLFYKKQYEIMGLIPLVIGIGMLYFLLNFKSNRITREDSRYQYAHEITIWIITVLLIIGGIILVIRDVFYLLMKINLLSIL